MTSDADHLLAALHRLASETELAKVRGRLPLGEEAFGLRMRDLFDTARAHRDMPLDAVEALLDHPAYEPRLAAFCVLDFKARRKPTEADRAAYCEIYLRRHDRITSWDMVDRAAPHVVGGYLAGRSLEPLHELAGGTPLQRRTAITAPLYFIGRGSDEDLAGAFAIAGRLAAEPFCRRTRRRCPDPDCGWPSKSCPPTRGRHTCGPAGADPIRISLLTFDRK